MSDWQVPGASGSRDGTDRPGGTTPAPGSQPSGVWSGQQPASGAWPGQQQPSGGWPGQQQHGGWPGAQPPSGGWSGKPGPQQAGSRPVLPLRPLGLGDVLSGAFTVLRRNARVLLLWSLLLSGVLGLVSTLAGTLGQQALQSRMFAAVDAGRGADAVTAGSITLWLLLSVALPFIASLGRGFLVAPVAVDTGQRILGRRASFGGLWRLLAGRRWSVLAWILLQAGAGVVAALVFGLVAFAGIAAIGSGSRAGLGGVVLLFVVLALGFGVLAAWLGTRFVFTVPTIALEGRSVFAAAAQSWRLTRRAFWRTFGILLLVQVVFGFAASIAATPLSIGALLVGGTFDPLGQTGARAGVGVGAVVALVVGSLLVIAVQCVVDVLSASITTFLAVDRRIRTEGLDQRIAAHLETGQPSDPFAPADPLLPAQLQPWPAQQQWAPQQQHQQWAPQQQHQQWAPQQQHQQWAPQQQPWSQQAPQWPVPPAQQPEPPTWGGKPDGRP